MVGNIVWGREGRTEYTAKVGGKNATNYTGYSDVKLGVEWGYTLKWENEETVIVCVCVCVWITLSSSWLTQVMQLSLIIEPIKPVESIMNNDNNDKSKDSQQWSILFPLKSGRKQKINNYRDF